MEIINSIEDLLNIFVPGLICVWMFGSLANRKYDIQTYLIFGSAMGAIIKSIVDIPNNVLLNSEMDFGIPILPAYVLTGIVFAIVYYKAKIRKPLI